MNDKGQHPNKPVSAIESVSKRTQIDSRELLGQCNEITIVHRGSEYRLRITSNDKLILTK
ncbi:hemin uptake protein HemP [Methylotuvimicrobium kenyense]|uniref:hemin uptake protein HemP n=1 Tax=Methylotuvimicrobium sp. KM1 TaxID=3377707 RepID=UPI001153D7A7